MGMAQAPLKEKRNLNLKDSVPTQVKDSLPIQIKDSISLDTIKPKESITSIITHKAEGYTLEDAKNKILTLYDQAHVTYDDIDLKAGIIRIDHLNSTLYAKGIIDSTGYTQTPIFKQGGEESVQDSLIYNFETEKAIIFGMKTEQSDGMIVLGKKAKRVNDSVIYMKKLRFTTSDKKVPDYYIGVDKAKIVPGKKIVAGLSNLVLADVPTPVILPFAYFPITENRSSGFVLPTWTNGSQRGFGLMNGGYYFVINDNFDLEILGDVYTNSSWSVRGSSQYYKRYKFSGSFSLNYEKLINSLRGFDDFSEASNFNIRWTHRKDPKSNPNSNFSASVNLGSSQYFRQSLNELNQSDFMTNTFNSSISYQKNFVGTPFNMSVTATHSQNSNTKQINMTLPSLQVNMNRIYPFAGEGGIKKNALQKIGLTYSMQGKYEINTPEEDFFKPGMFDKAQAGAQHNITASTNMRMFKYFTLSPSVNYREIWNLDYIDKYYDANTQTAVTDTISGFKSFRDYSASMSLSTNIYGTFDNVKIGRIRSIRHTIRPSVSFSYRPDLGEQHLRYVQNSADPNDLISFTHFDQGIYGRPSQGKSGSIGIAINNTLEAKLAPKDPDSDEEMEKVSLLNNLNLSTSYNMAADSLKWSDLRVSTGTRLLKDKLALNVNASFDPYQVDKNTGRRIDKFNKGIYRLKSANITANYSINSNTFSKKDEDEKKDNKGNGAQNTPDVFGKDMQSTNRSGLNSQGGNNQNKVTKTELYKATIPWSLNLAYSAAYANNGYSTNGIQSHSIMFSGNLELSPKWKVNLSSGYDVKKGGFTFTRLNFNRDLDSWNFSFNWVPFGYNQSYNFFIGVSSGLLKDLKYDQNRPPNRTLF